MFTVNAQIISINIQDEECALFPSLEIEKNKKIEIEIVELSDKLK